MKKFLTVLMVVFVSFIATGLANAAEPVVVKVNIDVTATPDMEPWALKCKALIEEWYPRACNMMLTEGFEPHKEINLVFMASSEGIADCAGNRIRIFAPWFRQHPDDIGAIFHEMVHSVQQYGRVRDWWLMEGMTDYYRWAIYEGKPLSYFAVPAKADGYKSGYQVTGGFLLWLESDLAPGIVSKLNQAYRKRQMDLNIFETVTGKTIDQLWLDYQVARGVKPKATQNVQPADNKQ
ncbi:MAG: hypothetical protein JXM68_14170 [Sedimentisphaerales bacterium]|nr:hypothetical protein [Sedimentisphaerales bacterium]